MGIHADAVAMSELTGKTVRECKKARMANDAKIGELSRSGKKTLEAMTEICFGRVAVAVAKATQPVAPPPPPPAPVEPQVQDPAPTPQVQPDEPIEKAVTAPPPASEPPAIETFDAEVIPLEQESKAAPEKKAKTTKKRRGRRRKSSE